MVVVGSSVGGYRALGKRHDCDTQVMAWEVTRQSFKCHFYFVCCQQGPVVMCMFKGWLLRKKDFLSLPGKTFFVVLISFHTFLILSPVFLNWNMICCTTIQYQRSELWMWFQRKIEDGERELQPQLLSGTFDSASLCSCSEIIMTLQAGTKLNLCWEHRPCKGTSRAHWLKG